MTVIKYTTAPVDGPESDVEYDEYGDAMNVAQRFGLQVIAVHYERADSGLVEDFTEYHWLLTAQCGGEEDDGYLPGNWSGHWAVGSQGCPSASWTRAWKKVTPCLAAVAR